MGQLAHGRDLLKVKGQWCYLYRAVDRHGQTIDFLLTEHRDKEAALRFPQIFHDEGLSGAQVQRPGLDAALAALTPGDVLVVWRLDRLGRSMPHLASLVHTLGLQGVGFQSLTEAINTTTAGGKLVFHIMGALAEFERALIAERSHAGMQAARQTSWPAPQVDVGTGRACRSDGAGRDGNRLRHGGALRGESRDAAPGAQTRGGL